jgi:hypothetical protein
MADTFSITDPRAASVTTTAPAPATRNPAAPPNEEAAAKLYPNTAKAEPNDPGTMYASATVYRPTLDKFLPRLGDANVLSFAEQERERTTFPDMVRKSGLDPSFGLRLYEKFAERRLEVLDDEARATRTADLEESTHQWLRENYALRGIKGKDFEALKGRVNRWMAKQPDLRAIVTFAGIGNELEIAQGLYEHVQMNGLGFDR